MGSILRSALTLSLSPRERVRTPERPQRITSPSGRGRNRVAISGEGTPPMKTAILILASALLSACGNSSAPDSSTLPPTSAPLHYEPTLESLSQHPLPRWWDEGKFGIFIHWGPYSVPARGGRDGASPYTAEWYWFAQNIAGPFASAWDYHRDTYGIDFVYDDFIPQFTASHYDPDAWIELFEASGARYFVLVAKHHDGYALWPSDTTGRDSFDLTPHRDLVGELMAANRNAGEPLKAGLYYSIPEWLSPAPYPPEYSAFYTEPNTPDPFPGLAFIAFNGQFEPRNAYTQVPVPYTGYVEIDDYAEDHVRPQMRELIQRYQPAMIWCDIGGSEAYFRSNEIIAEYYNQAVIDQPEGVVVNDRCGDLDATHYDYRVSEVSGTHEGQAVEGRFETVMTMGFSWGHDSEESEGDKKSAETLIETLVDVVAHGGNLLLNIGPRADGTVPEWQVERLQAIGDWLQVNGEAIYGSQAYETPAEGALRFTIGADGTRYLHLLEWRGTELRLSTPILEGARQLELLGQNAAPIAFARDGQQWVVSLPEATEQAVHVLRAR